MGDPATPRDPRADSRFRRGLEAMAAGALAEAAEMMEQALMLAPVWAGAWVALGGVFRAQGDDDKAAAAFETALGLDPADRHGAALALACLTGEPPGAASDAYIATLFDAYAARFDAHLTRGLGYTGPAALVAALREAGHADLGRSLDLGCGTGLCGEALRRASVTDLAGVDLSPAMIEVARLKQAAGRPLYDRLDVASLQTFLNGEPSASADTIAAGDVFLYLGDLRPTFAAAARVLRPGGALAFTLQRSEGPGRYRVGSDLRFAHSPAYLRVALAAEGLEARSFAERSVRFEKGAPVPGLVVVAMARGGGA